MRGRIDRLLRAFAGGGFCGRSGYADRHTLPFDKVGVLVALLIAVALTLEPFVAFRANRISAACPLDLSEVFPGWQGGLLYAAGTASAIIASFRGQPAKRLCMGVVLLAGISMIVGLIPQRLVTSDHLLARVAPAGGVWMLFFAYAILVIDSITKLSFGPGRRLLALTAALVLLAMVLRSGLWDGLSVMQEYAVRADSFWSETIRHITLVGISVVAAVSVGVPLGVACANFPALSGVLLPVLNIIQTVPSIAMYGLLITPLAVIAQHVPLAEALGVRGIGVAPAIFALFLYSLLPITSNVMLGLQLIPRQAIEAAVAMGMTSSQRLLQVELPLALPVILSGVRVVLVQNIGLATVAALIGAGGLGVFVFQGLGQSADDLVLLGAIPTITLALIASIVFEVATSIVKGGCE
jgi:osmoprotectant transport system permease protein